MSLRLKNYISALIVTLICYILLISIGVELADTLSTIGFFLSSVLYIFTTEEQVPPEEIISYPQNHYYQKSRINIYGYITVISFIITTLLFYVLTLNTNISQGLISLSLWIFVAAVSYFAGIQSDKNLYQSLILDYLSMKFIDQVDRATLLQILEEIISEKNQKEDHLENVIKKMKFNLNESLIKKIVKEYLDYVLATNEEANSDEIRTLNSRK